MKKSLTNMLILLNFFTCKMQEGTSLKVHLNFFDDLMMKTKTIDLNADEEQKTKVILCFLPERYIILANSLIYGRSTLTLKDVKTTLFE